MWKAGTGHAVEVDDEVEVEDDWETDADFVVRRAGPHSHPSAHPPLCGCVPGG